METTEQRKDKDQLVLDDYSKTGIIKAIYERRAVRKYKDIPVEREIIEKIVEAGSMAPSAMNKQPWKFYILTTKDVIKEFSAEIAKTVNEELLKAGSFELWKGKAATLSPRLDLSANPDPVFYSAPAVIFISAPRDSSWAAIDVGMCSQNIMLAAKAFGLETCSIGFAKYVQQTKLQNRLHVPFSEQIHLAIILGYGDELPDMHPRNKANVTYINSLK